MATQMSMVDVDHLLLQSEAIFRPDMFKEEWFQPDHFLGAFAEGTLVSKVGIGYIAGYGNGRETDLGYGCAGDPTCTSHNRAAVVRIFARPPGGRSLLAPPAWTVLFWLPSSS